MPTHILAQCCWQTGSMLPRDMHCITPTFRVQADWDPLGGTDWDNLANDLANALIAWGTASTNKQLTVRLYLIGGTKPNRPKATVIKNPGLSAEPTIPRELALCLSFYGGQNDRTQRGRLYLPAWLIGATSPGARPTATDRTRAEGLVSPLASLGGVNVDWIVWSRKLSAATKVTNYWVDDEWDVQRRRGLRPTTRTAGTTGG